MNLVELYAETPVARHGDIRVVAERVFVKDDEGNVDEYIKDGQGELWLVHSDKELKADIKAIKNKLGA